MQAAPVAQSPGMAVSFDCWQSMANCCTRKGPAPQIHSTQCDFSPAKDLRSPIVIGHRWCDTAHDPAAPALPAPHSWLDQACIPGCRHIRCRVSLGMQGMAAKVSANSLHVAETGVRGCSALACASQSHHGLTLAALQTHKQPSRSPCPSYPCEPADWLSGGRSAHGRG